MPYLMPLQGPLSHSCTTQQCTCQNLHRGRGSHAPLHHRPELVSHRLPSQHPLEHIRFPPRCHPVSARCSAGTYHAWNVPPIPASPDHARHSGLGLKATEPHLLTSGYVNRLLSSPSQGGCSEQCSPTARSPPSFLPRPGLNTQSNKYDHFSNMHLMPNIARHHAPHRRPPVKDHHAHPPLHYPPRGPTDLHPVHHP
jgi:hypothetical protein